MRAILIGGPQHLTEMAVRDGIPDVYVTSSRPSTVDYTATVSPITDLDIKVERYQHMRTYGLGRYGIFVHDSLYGS